ncbi:hypothetical protein DFH08DRAFT_998014 [Mycena albidolilacea]|uniref:Uncharacterized protein n=1 Tax=Mycena albidolilacea TaxID=1033008 RepID=A0AAD7A3F9_9AGAR|nr:hypothetical protein DFH08DRAFT_998014 [Mycena albidolilacea]
MSDHSLPDEIISEILSPALKIPDEVFCDTSDVSPFAKYSESTSAYLLVCKSWLRVATPLLYNTVVLRSKAQAKALSVILSGNEQLGQFIKKLRVEGGYGLPMHIILKCTPNVSDLFLSLEIYSSDNTNGLCKGLALINPARLILRDIEHLENKTVSQLSDALSKSITKWDRLCVFECSFPGQAVRAKKIVSSLTKSKLLHTVVVTEAYCLSWVYSKLKGCPLKVFRIKRQLGHRDRSYIPDNPVLMRLLKFTETPDVRNDNRALDPFFELPLIPPYLNTSFIPMASAPKEVHDRILARILYFALTVSEVANPIHRKLSLLLRIGLPYYYAQTTLANSSATSGFVSVLLKTPSLGPHVRSLDIQYPTQDSSGSIVVILSQTPALVRFYGYNSSNIGSNTLRKRPGISWAAFEALVKYSGSTLRECQVDVGAPSASASATIFDNLTALRILTYGSRTAFVDVANADGLPNLEELQISSGIPSLLAVLSQMELKSLRRVALLGDATGRGSETFIKVHGEKLTQLDIPHKILGTLNNKIFELCPNLRSLLLLACTPMQNPPAVDTLYSPRAVPSLIKLTFSLPYFHCDKHLIPAWERFFLEFEPKCLPNLREIENRVFRWPTSEREIKKSCWVRWAEMLSKRGIDLTDGAGTKWRPRLKVK